MADQLDYIAQKRIEQSKVEIEKLETKIKADIEFLLNNVGEKASKQIEHINQVREAAIKDLRETIGQTDEEKLRFFTPDGQLISTSQEAAAAEQQQRQLAQQQALAAQQQVTELESLLARYRERFGDLPD